MSTPNTDTTGRMVRQESLPDAHGHLSHENARYLAAVDEALNDLVTLRRVRRSHAAEWLTACRHAAESGPKTRILRYLALNDETFEATYDDLAAVVERRPRTVRKHVADLRDAGLVTVEDVGHAVVSHRSAATYLLLNEAFTLAEQ